FNKAFDETVGISDKVGKVLKAVADMVIFFREHLRQTIAVIVATGSAILWAFSPTIVGGVLALAGWLKKATYAMMAFNVATMANPVGAMASAMLRLGLAITGGTAAFYGMRSILKDTTTTYDSLLDQMNEFIGLSRRQTEVTERQREE